MATTEANRLKQRIDELEAELADERGELRPGEQIDLCWSAGGAGSTSYFATDLATGLQVHAEADDDRGARRSALRLLRRCLANVDETAEARLHSTFCRCGSEKCMWSQRELSNPERRQMGRSDNRG